MGRNLMSRIQLKHDIEVRMAEDKARKRMMYLNIVALGETEGYGKVRSRRHIDTVSRLSKEWEKIAAEDGAEYADSVLERRAKQIVKDGEK